MTPDAWVLSAGCRVRFVGLLTAVVPHVLEGPALFLLRSDALAPLLVAGSVRDGKLARLEEAPPESTARPLRV